MTHDMQHMTQDTLTRDTWGGGAGGKALIHQKWIDFVLPFLSDISVIQNVWLPAILLFQQCCWLSNIADISLLRLPPLTIVVVYYYWLQDGYVMTDAFDRGAKGTTTGFGVGLFGGGWQVDTSVYQERKTKFNYHIVPI